MDDNPALPVQLRLARWLTNRAIRAGIRFLQGTPWPFHSPLQTAGLIVLRRLVIVSLCLRSATQRRYFDWDEESSMGLFTGKKGLVFGIANDHSIAWAITEKLHAEGAEMGS